jgi:hypothetical protein
MSYHHQQPAPPELPPCGRVVAGRLHRQIVARGPPVGHRVPRRSAQPPAPRIVGSSRPFDHLTFRLFRWW